MEEQKKVFFKKNFIIFFIFLFIFISFILVFFGQKRLSKQKSEADIKEKINLKQTISPTNIEKTVKEEENGITELVLKKNDSFNFEIIASSNNYDITGFDIVIEAESSSDLNAITFSSLSESFSLYPLKKENFLIISGIKKLNINQPTIFNNTPIIALKTTKAIKINLKPFWNKYSTKFVDNNNNIFKPKIILK
mgnify:CR=1 FL=1